MDELISRYPLMKGSNEMILFKTFYDEQNLKPIDDWIQNKFKNDNIIKSNIKSKEFRNQGNDYYKKKELEKSLNFYEKSLSFAQHNSCEYGMALANRSAVQFMLRDFKDCLQNIDLCLKSEYPEDMRAKLYIRKAECYQHLEMKEQLDEMILFIEKLNDPVINHRLIELKQPNSTRIAHNISICLPNVKNDKFFGASSKIILQYDDQYGRHVVANEDLEVGSILFVERAFSFALIFEENGNLKVNKCYHCLTDYKYGIPCKACTFCFYCTESCRDSSWDQDHQFECAGMVMWYDLGIALPALKCMLKGVKSHFKKYLHHPRECIVKFGDKNDNYEYFSSLVTHTSKMENVTPLIVTSVIIAQYLKNKTNFFDTISEIMKSEEDLYSFIGGLIIQHICQLERNSSIIQHWSTQFPLNENTQLESCMESRSIINLDECKPVACGIFLTLSMMNHSCKSNISMYFIKDTVIVKAAQLIKKGEEVFNCYGVEYETMGKVARQEVLQALYYFKCECDVCSNPEKEYNNMFNCFLCEKCNGKMEFRNENNYFCNRCNHLRDANSYNNIENLTLFVLNESNQLEKLLECLQEMDKRFYKYHDRFYEYYIKLMKFYAELGDIEKYVNYKRKVYELVRKTHGIYSKKFALLWYDTDISKEFNGKCVEDVLKLYYPIEEIIIR